MDNYTKTIKAAVLMRMAVEGGSADAHLNAICAGLLFDKPAWLPVLAWEKCTKSGRLYLAACQLECESWEPGM